MTTLFIENMRTIEIGALHCKKDNRTWNLGVALTLRLNAPSWSKAAQSLCIRRGRENPP